MSKKKGKLKVAFNLVKRTAKEFGNVDPMTYAAAIAFYTVFSLPAVVFIIVFSAGYFYGQEAVTGELYFQIKDLVGQEAAAQIQDVLSNVNTSGSSFWATLLTIGALVFGATTVFVSLQKGLNAIWGVKPKPSSGIVKLLLDRLFSFAFVLSMGFLLLVSLVIDAVLVGLQDYIKQFLPQISIIFAQIANVVVSLLVISSIFTLMFKLLPDVKNHWRQCWVGGIVTSVLFFLGKYLIAFYMSTSDMTSTYGAAGSLVLILIWVFYSSIILLLGGKITEVYVKEVEGQIRPSRFAVITGEHEKTSPGEGIKTDSRSRD